MPTLNGTKRQQVALPDFSFENHGSVWLCRALNSRALAHLREHVGAEAQWLGNALAVEPCYVGELAGALQDEGWSTARA